MQEEPQDRPSDVNAFGEGSAAGRDIPSGGVQPRRGDRFLTPRTAQALRRSGFAGRALSLAAILSILALFLSWLTAVARWRSGSLLVDRTGEMTLYRFVAADSRMERFFRLFALGLIVMAGLLGARVSRRPRLPPLVVFFFVTMLIYAGFWCLVTYKPSQYWPDLEGTTSPLMFAMCLGVFAGFDTSVWRRLEPVVLAIGYGSAALGVYYALTLSMKGRFEGSNPTVEHLQIAFWFGLFALVLRKSSRWRHCLPAFVPLALCIPMAMVIGSRSFTVLAVIGLTTALMIPLQRHLRLLVVRVVALGVLATLVLGVGLWLLSVAAPDQLQTLQDRLLDDTRTGQYSQFFRQVPVLSLIPGLGPKATYTYNDWAHYDYIDNQFLFILFKWGLPVLAGYCAVVLWPGVRMVFRRGRQRQRLVGGVFVCWVLATLGLSIYHGITINPQNFLIILLAGRCWGALLQRPQGLVAWPSRELNARWDVSTQASGVSPRPSRGPHRWIRPRLAR